MTKTTTQARLVLVPRLEECAACGEWKEVSLHDAMGFAICDACRCPCCGGIDCACDIEDVSGDDRETGPFSETVCHEHGCRVSPKR